MPARYYPFALDDEGNLFVIEAQDRGGWVRLDKRLWSQPDRAKESSGVTVANNLAEFEQRLRRVS